MIYPPASFAPSPSEAVAAVHNPALAKNRFADCSQRSNFASWFRNMVRVLLGEIAETAEADIVRFTAAKWLAERGFGGVPINPDENPGSPQIVRVITGVHGDGISATPQSRPLLPDGRDPFEQHSAPSGSRPVGRAPVAEPLQHRLFEGPSDSQGRGHG